jgi:hypothetical protein
MLVCATFMATRNKGTGVGIDNFVAMLNIRGAFTCFLCSQQTTFLVRAAVVGAIVNRTDQK